jgi:hypothetical protein
LSGSARKIPFKQRHALKQREFLAGILSFEPDPFPFIKENEDAALYLITQTFIL